MFKILVCITIFALKFASADLIGYNRLGNNVESHVRHRDVSPSSYTSQLMQFVINNPALSNEKKKSMMAKLIRMACQSAPVKRNQRLSHYRNRMIKR